MVFTPVPPGPRQQPHLPRRELCVGSPQGRPNRIAALRRGPQSGTSTSNWMVASPLATTGMWKWKASAKVAVTATGSSATSSRGPRIQPSKVLLDPAARAISGWDVYDRVLRPVAQCPCLLKAVVCERDLFDFQAHPRRATAGNARDLRAARGGFPPAARMQGGRRRAPRHLSRIVGCPTSRNWASRLLSCCRCSVLTRPMPRAATTCGATAPSWFTRTMATAVTIRCRPPDAPTGGRLP